MLNSFRDCCSNVWDVLPRAELPFIPALILGTLFSLLILAWLYKKHHKKTLSHAFVEMFKDIFTSVPVLDHSEFMKCGNQNCVRCKKSDQLKVSIIEQWKEMQDSGQFTEFDRIADSIKTLSTLQDEPKKTSQKPTLFSMNLSANPIWTDLDAFHIDKQLLKMNFKTIRSEFERIFKVFQSGKTEGWKLNHIPSGHWCIYPLIDQGVTNLENSFKCPQTISLIKNLPAMMKNCVFGNACFSLLYQDSHIEPHFGPTNIRLRCHLGLSIPKEKCWLEVDGEQITWKERECLVFDDSFEHSAYFESKKCYVQPRAVLLMDFWHPQITSKEKQVLLKLLHP